MPTCNRRRFVAQAIWYFLRQDYPQKELIVVDDGDDRVGDLMPPDPRIRYVHLGRRVALGAKRNIGCEMARGELIAHWDDDDWIAPHRLSTQVDQLQESGAEICGAAEVMHYGLDTGEAWLYRPRADDRPWLAGGTLLYRREAWTRSPFPAINAGEDTEFVSRQPAERMHTVRDRPFYVALIHRENTSPRRLSDERWQRRPLDEVTQLLACDRDFYVGLRHGRSTADTSRSPVDSISVGATFMVYDGYGSMAELLVLGMKRAGATVHPVPLYIDANGISEELRELLRQSRPDPRAPALYFCWPDTTVERFRQSQDLFFYTMWESSLLPADWPERLNAARAVFVPTRFVADVFRKSGVTVPLEVIPLGVDADVYHYVERPEREQLTALIVGTVTGRKHVREAIAGWKLAFAADRDARLIIKSRFRYGNYDSDDPRITIVDDSEPTRGIAHWYERADVLLAVGNEGFGLPLVEGMATGLPVIALSSEGQGDVCEDAGSERVLAVQPERWEEYDEPQFGRCGIRGVPDVAQIADRLRWVAGHRAEARAMGRAASAWAIEHRNIAATAPAVLDAMERHAHPPRPLRKLPTLWVPSWQTPCGIAEYTAHLADNMRGVRVAAQMPDSRSVRLLHVQHEGSLFHDTALTACVQQVRLERMPVVITEHTVGTDTKPWERDASALTALTERGAGMLRARWPQKRVEYLPCGCPTWFPPRKKRRGRVIGAFGFLEHHKGFWKLLELVRALPGTELLLVSHSKGPENERKWSADAAGLPVRHYKKFLPVEDAARLLAAEADILAYWYDDTIHASASAAVRVGLATGVPVLASRTGWFHDLRGVTYQPEDLVEGTRRLLEDSVLRSELTSAARDYCHQHSWPNMAERHLALWQSLDAVN